MNKSHLLAYNYLNLPCHKKIEICKQLCILPKDWRNLKSQEFDLAIFKKLGKNKNKLKQFEKLILTK